MSATAGLLLLFLDGVGIGPADEHRNPFLTADLSWLRSALGGGLPTVDDPSLRHRSSQREIVSLPLDARLGVDGVPQSGTGQTTLLTGRNAAELFGRHFGPWVPVQLRPMLERSSLLRRAVDAGQPAAFANAYPASWSTARGGRWPAAPPFAARAAGLLTRDHQHLARGEAVASEILNSGWKRRLGFDRLPDVTALDAGRTLGSLSAAHRFTFFAHYSTDTVGHDGDRQACEAALTRVDGFLRGVCETLPADHYLLVCSDHGNIEDLGERGHTLNPALGLLAGPQAFDVGERLRSLMDIAPVVGGLLGI